MGLCSSLQTTADTAIVRQIVVEMRLDVVAHALQASWREALVSVLPPALRTSSASAKISHETPDGYRRMSLLAFFSRKAASKACICPLLR